MKLMIRPVHAEISPFEIYKMAEILSSLDRLSVKITETALIGEHCVKISVYYDKNSRRRSVLKMQTDRRTDRRSDGQTERQTHGQTRRPTDNKGRYYFSSHTNSTLMNVCTWRYLP